MPSSLRPLILVLSLGAIAVSAFADDWPITPPEPLQPIEMVLVKGGCFMMGDTFAHGAENERPVHQVCVKDFYLGKYPVTQIQWTGTMGSNPSREANCGLACPVENVSWNDVQEFLAKIGKRTGKAYQLPTEAEWEFAARSGGKAEEWAGTSSTKELGDYAWYYNNSAFETHPVGMKKPNGLGLYDMTGNVWEWTSDTYDAGYYAKSPRNDPQCAGSGEARALRGGYWGDLASFVRVARRIGLPPATRGDGYGFRVALPAP